MMNKRKIERRGKVIDEQTERKLGMNGILHVEERLGSNTDT
jgi:hypothetical protein